MNKLLAPIQIDGFKFSKFEYQDICPEYLETLNDREHMKYSDQQFFTHTTKSAKEYIDFCKDSNHYFVKISNNLSNYLGSSTFYNEDNGYVTNLSIVLNHNFVGKGFGKRIWNLLVNDISPYLNFNIVNSGTISSNVAMIKAFEFSGMEMTSIQKNMRNYNGQFFDIVNYSKAIIL